MRLFAHDLNAQELVLLRRYLPGDAVVISDSGEICNCTGCFGCWIKTPGRCVLKDGYQNMGELLAKCDEFVIISKCIYGSYSPFIRNIWDRSISYLLPYFVTRQGETHHQNRYDHHFRLSVYFYGDDVTPAEVGGENIPAPGDVVVPSDKINELMSKKKPTHRGRPPKTDRAGQVPAPEKTDEAPKKERKPRAEKQKLTSAKKAPAKEETPAPEPEPPQEPKEPPRKGETEQIVFLNLSELHAFKNHPFQVRDDDEMRAKSDTATVTKIKAAIAAAYADGEAKLKGNGKSVPPLAALKTPLRDGDIERPDDEAYKDHWFVNANSNTAPGVVDINREPIFDTKEIYSGVYARVCLSFYAFNSSGNKCNRFFLSDMSVNCLIPIFIFRGTRNNIYSHADGGKLIHFLLQIIT